MFYNTSRRTDAPAKVYMAVSPNVPGLCDVGRSVAKANVPKAEERSDEAHSPCYVKCPACLQPVEKYMDVLFIFHNRIPFAKSLKSFNRNAISSFFCFNIKSIISLSL